MLKTREYQSDPSAPGVWLLWPATCFATLRNGFSKLLSWPATRVQGSTDRLVPPAPKPHPGKFSMKLEIQLQVLNYITESLFHGKIKLIPIIVQIRISNWILQLFE